MLSLILTSASLSDDCSGNCYTCLNKNQCFQCYKRQLVQRDSESVCSTVVPQASDHCLLYAYLGCVRCEAGWAVRSEPGTAKRVCLKSTIQNCVDELSPGPQFSNSCYGCLEGYPSPDRTKCISASKFVNSIANCKIGGSENRKLVCHECQPGFISDAKTCFKTPPNLVGCLLAGSKRKNCYDCDVKNGYFMRDPFTCSKNQVEMN